MTERYLIWGCHPVGMQLGLAPFHFHSGFPLDGFGLKPGYGRAAVAGEEKGKSVIGWRPQMKACLGSQSQREESHTDLLIMHQLKWHVTCTA